MYGTWSPHSLTDSYICDYVSIYYYSCKQNRETKHTVGLSANPLFHWDFKALIQCIKELRQYSPLWWATDSLNIYIFKGLSEHLFLLYIPPHTSRQGRCVPYMAVLFHFQSVVMHGGSIRTTLVSIRLPTKRVVFPHIPQTLRPTFGFSTPWLKPPAKTKAVLLLCNVYATWKVTQIYGIEFRPQIQCLHSPKYF